MCYLHGPHHDANSHALRYVPRRWTQGPEARELVLLTRHLGKRPSLLRRLPNDGATNRGHEAQVPHVPPEGREQAPGSVQEQHEGLLAPGAKAHDRHEEGEEIRRVAAVERRGDTGAFS